MFVYFNLHKKTFSIKALEGENKGKVIGYSDTVTLSTASPKVSEAGRQRVLKEKRKNVHSGIVGRVESILPTTITECMDRIEYNPYKYTTFVYSDIPSVHYSRSSQCSLSVENGKVNVYVK